MSPACSTNPETSSHLILTGGNAKTFARLFPQNSDFFVGNNSGPLNLSAALGIQSFGLIANDPIDELKYSKIQIITPENYNNLRYRSRDGMKKLSAERVFKKIMENIN